MTATKVLTSVTRAKTTDSAPKRSIVLGCAMTGAKYTPRNHYLRKDRILDAICCGDTIPCKADEIVTEAAALYEMGCRYIHIHARNGRTREQTANLTSYSYYGRNLFVKCPQAVLSYGGSRNGVEIDDTVAKGGEFSRVAHMELPLRAGGAHFVTGQAAVELQIILDMEHQGYLSVNCETGDFKVLKKIKSYVPADKVAQVKLDVHATKGARNYGASSAAIQYGVLKRSVAARSTLSLPFECEWTQLSRSFALTHLLAHEFDFGFERVRRLNITILFGFSPRLPFPKTYSEFKRAVDKALSIGRDGTLIVTVACGASVLPQHASSECRKMDVGPLKGQRLSPADIIAAYCAMPDSGVSIVRVGLEDTPYAVTRDSRILPTTNLDLAERARYIVEQSGGSIELTPSSIIDEKDINRTSMRPIGVEEVRAA